MSRPRCRAIVNARHYSKPGQCEITANVKDVVIREGGDQQRVKLCPHHKKLVDGRRPLEFAR